MSIEILAGACHSLVTAKNDFWLLAALTDNSYEEGTRNVSFSRSVQVYRKIGLQAPLIADLEHGINGNLCAEVSRSPQVIEGSVFQYQSSCPDIYFRTNHGETYVESKLIYDCTTQKWYSSEVPKDAFKLATHRAPARTLLQVIFFVQLPNHDYPSGKWSGSNRWYDSRVTWVKCADIRQQFAKLSRHLPGTPVHPLTIQPLTFPSEEVGVALAKDYFANAMTPMQPWSLDAERSFNDAAVGYAIWQH